MRGVEVRDDRFEVSSMSVRAWNFAVQLSLLTASQVYAQVEDEPAAPESSPPPTAAPASVEVAPAAPPPTATIEQAPAENALPGESEPPDEQKAVLGEWTRHVKLGGGAILYYYQPLEKHQKNDLSFFYGRLDLDVNIEDFGFHLEPRFRDGKLRSFYEGPAWIEEGYASWAFGTAAKLKVGKVYSRLGLFWDNSFYGNVQVYDGIKLAPDYGASLEGSVGERIGVNYWAQFFLVDGRTNVSQPGRDTVSVPGARRRNEIVLNVEPFVKFGTDGMLNVGGSLQHLRADLPGGDDSVLRLAAHAKLTVAGFGAWGEFLHQNGRHVTAFPIAGTPANAGSAAVPGVASGDNSYFELGAEYALGVFALRYNVSYGRYADVRIHEVLHVPGISIKLIDSLKLLAELALWKRYAPGGSSDVDKSLNVTLHASI
jgi:hypothetical protein